MARALRLDVKVKDGKTVLVGRDSQVVHTVTSVAEEKLLQKLALIARANGGKIALYVRAKAYGFTWPNG